MGTQSIVLLETLKRLMDEQAARAAATGADGSTPFADGAFSAPSEEGDDSLLVGGSAGMRCQGEKFCKS